MIRIRPTRRSRASLLTRSFLLAFIFWTLKFVIPRMPGWVSLVCQDISEFKRSISTRANEIRRRGRNSKSHRDEEPKEALPTLESDNQSISPSVLEIIDFVDLDDDGSSFISRATSISSVSTFFGSFARSRSRRNRASQPLSAVSGRFASSSAHSTKRPQAKPSRAKNSKASTPRSKQRPYADEENGNIIDKDQVRIKVAADKTSHHSKQRQRKENHNNEWLDDISHVPVTGNIHGNHGNNPKRSQKSGSPLDRKINVSSHESNDVMDGYSRQKYSQRGKQNNHRQDGRK